MPEVVMEVHDHFVCVQNVAVVVAVAAVVAK